MLPPLTLILTTLTILASLASAQVWPYYTKLPTPIDWTFQYSANGTPTSVLLADDMHGLNSPLRSRITAFFGASQLQTTDPKQVDKFWIQFLKSDLYKELDKTLPELNGTQKWAGTRSSSLSRQKRSLGD